MTTTMHTEMLKLADKAATHITRLGGESDSFEVESNGIIAVVTYLAEIGEDAGDYWTAPSWWIKSETATVEGVYDEEGNNDTEAAAWLAKQLN